jgi:hypothetical protein
VDMIHRHGLVVKPPRDAARWTFHGEAPRGEAGWNRRALEGEAPRQPQMPLPGVR